MSVLDGVVLPHTQAPTSTPANGYAVVHAALDKDCGPQSLCAEWSREGWPCRSPLPCTYHR